LAVDLEILADKNAQLLQDALDTVNGRIADLIAELEQNGGVLVNKQANLAKALSMRAEIATVFAEEFDGVSADVVASLSEAAREAVQELEAVGVSSAFTKADGELVRLMLEDVGAEIDGLSMRAQSEISQSIYKNVVAASPRSYLKAEVEQLLVGKKDIRGVPMVVHAETIARTRLMEINSLLTLKKANEAGVTKFKYVGGLVRDSRQWCKEHVGKIYTLNEIMGWEKIQWAGKKAGNPFIVRGGWNCIHRWRAVVD